MTGTATVAQGTLAIGGAFGGSVQVNAGATLEVSPTGSLGAPAASTRRGITVATAGAAGTSTIAGDLTLAPGSIYQVSIGSDGTAPLLVTDGVARLGGAMLDVRLGLQPATRVSETPLIAAINGLSGTVALHSTDPSIDTVVTPVGNTLVLSLLDMNAPLAAAATTGNAVRAGAAIDRIKAGATGDLANVVRELTALDDGSLSSALAAAAGEIHASDVQMAALDAEAITDLVQGRMTDRRVVREHAQATSGRWQLGRQWWAQLVGQTARFDATSDAHGGDATLGGVAVGMDQTLGQGWLVGVGGSYERGTLTLNGTTASSDFTAPRVLAYAGRTAGAWTLRAGSSLAWAANDTSRHMVFAATLAPVFGGQPLFAGVDRTATSAQRGLTTDVWSDVQSEAVAGGWAFQPRAGIRYAHFANDAWSESDAGALSLAAPAQATASAQADGGIRIARATGSVSPFGVFTYRRELTDGATTTAVQLTTNAAGEFTVDGLPFARDTVLVGGGVRMPLGRGDLSVTYQLRHADGQTRHTASVGIGF